ncbi:MAG TPA: hypothetical protein VFT50_14325 [Baekduia sp.]|nr:hypothetical protein [Baekduia sp.]
MDGALWILLAAAVAIVPAALLHELTRAAVALLLTRGRVCVLLGAGGARWALRAGRLLIGVTAQPWWGGECAHDPVPAGRRAAILLAGPLAGDVAFVAAAVTAARWAGATDEHAGLQVALWTFGLVALARACADLVATCAQAASAAH